MKKRFTFSLDPKIIAEIEKIDEKKSRIVESALKLYLQQHDNKQPGQSPGATPLQELDTQRAEIDGLKKTTGDLVDILTKVSERMDTLESRMDSIFKKIGYP